MTQERSEPQSSPDEDFVRVPGLFRRWEIPDVVEPGDDFHLEEAGTASDGTPLYALYRRERNTLSDNEN